MTTTFKTEQEAFWAGDFGSDYSDRNVGAKLLAGNCALLSQVLRRTGTVHSVIEFGANIGLNLEALKILLPDVERAAVEINPKAAAVLRQRKDLEIFEASILEFTPPRQWDLVLVKGLLIHTHPEALPAVYQKLFETSARFIVIAEYYNRTAVEIPYRGHDDRLFKRDFAGDMLDRWPSLNLLDYGFCYHRDPAFPQDDITWFVLEKRP